MWRILGITIGLAFILAGGLSIYRYVAIEGQLIYELILGIISLIIGLLFLFPINKNIKIPSIIILIFITGYLVNLKTQDSFDNNSAAIIAKAQSLYSAGNYSAAYKLSREYSLVENEVLLKIEKRSKEKIDEQKRLSTLQAEREERQLAIENLHTKIRGLSEDDFKGKRDAYEKLLEYEPDNMEYSQKVADYNKKIVPGKVECTFIHTKVLLAATAMVALDKSSDENFCKAVDKVMTYGNNYIEKCEAGEVQSRLGEESESAQIRGILVGIQQEDFCGY